MALFIYIIFYLVLEVKSQGLPKAKLTIVPTFATDEEEVQMVCKGYEDQHMSECMFYPAGQETFSKPSASCDFSINGTDLIAWSQNQESSYVNIYCYYTVHGVNETSPHSDRVSVRVRGLTAMSSLPPITQGSPTTMILNGTFQANLSTASTTNTTTSLAITSSTEIIIDPITNMSSPSTHDSHSHRFTDPANGESSGRLL
ncbi:uncharacterized protein [Garra rufa]|uniref:uncharacterized protein n=1 Tax=Garra rufa TaxID=137080 RepID=UPI003CCE90D6